MENIFNSENIGNIGETVEKKLSGVSSNTLLCAAAGSLLLAATLKLTGNSQASTFFGKWAVPLLVIGCYKKYSNSSFSKTNDNTEVKESQIDDPIAST